MKAIVESFVVMCSFDEIGRENYNEALVEFNALLCLINNASDEEMLRTLLTNSVFNHFEHGFGSSHFWVHQIVNGEISNNRILIVQF